MSGQPLVHRLDTDDALRLLGAVSDVGGFFMLAHETSATPIARLAARDVAHAGQETAATMGTTQARVALSTWHLGVAARLWSVALGAWAIGRASVDMGSLRRRRDGTLGVDPTEPPAVHVGPGAADHARAEALATFDHLGRTVRDAIAHDGGGSLASSVLWGNVASSLANGLMVIHRTPGLRDADADLTGPTVSDLVGLVLAEPRLSGALAATGNGRWQRKTCCLYYRAGRGGLCGDCPLPPDAVTA